MLANLPLLAVILGAIGLFVGLLTYAAIAKQPAGSAGMRPR